MTVFANRFRLRLFDKALLILICVTGIAIIEVVLALSFKNELKREFLIVASFDERERDYLLGLMAASGLTHEMTIPEKGMIFLKVSHWSSTLHTLADIEARLTARSGRSSPQLFGQDYEELKRLLSNSATDEVLAEFAFRVKRHVNTFGQRVNQDVARIREERARLVQAYGTKSDLYAWILLAVGLIGFSLVAIAAGIFLHRLVRSLERLVTRAGRIAAGSYGEPVPTNRTDEVGNLVESINTMAASLERREKEMEEFRQRLFRQEKLFTIGSFAGGIAHEVGNPIQSIMAINAQNMESLMEDTSEANIEGRIEKMEIIAEQAERLMRAVDEIRQFSYVGENEQELMGINEVITTTFQLMRFDHRFRNISLTQHLSPDLPLIKGISDHMTQVFINLLINAADALHGDENQIVMTTSLDGDEVVISVADNGSGMSTEALQHALEPFFTTKERGKGTGLGLAVCKQIIEEHEGTLDIKSVVGEGTVVTIRLAVERSVCASERLAS